jgi:hypothetical protein
MTNVLVVILVVLFIFFTFLPLKFIFTLSLLYKFYMGSSWQRKRGVNNREVARIELANFLAEKGFVMNFDEQWET